jgi:hypothetical protein
MLTCESTLHGPSGCGLPNPPLVLTLRSYAFKEAVERTACQMSRSADPPFRCPDFTCPVDLTQFGYPWIEMPDHRPGAVARNGFEPVSMTQFPPPGAIHRYGSTIPYTVTGVDATNRTESCAAAVYVPPLTACGTVNLNVTGGVGSSNRRAPFVQYPNRTLSIATAYKMKGILSRRLRGSGTATARLYKGGDKQNGAITFRGNQTKGALNNVMVTANFNFLNVSRALQVDLQVRNNANAGPNLARFDVYCQVALSYATQA